MGFGVGHAVGIHLFSYSKTRCWLRLGAGYKARPSGAAWGRFGPSRAEWGRLVRLGPGTRIGQVGAVRAERGQGPVGPGLSGVGAGLGMHSDYRPTRIGQVRRVGLVRGRVAE